MRNILLAASLCCAFAILPAHAQVPVQANLDHEKMLASADPRLAANKRLVYDFWREVFEGGHMEFADKYMAESYIQHNPTVPTGRAAFVDFFSKFSKPKPIEPKVKAPLVSFAFPEKMLFLLLIIVLKGKNWYYNHHTPHISDELWKIHHLEKSLLTKLLLPFFVDQHHIPEKISLKSPAMGQGIFYKRFYKY